MNNLITILEQTASYSDPKWTLREQAINILCNIQELRANKQKIVNLQQSQVANLIKLFTTFYHNNEANSKRILNGCYEALSIYSKQNKKDICNNFSLAYINMQAFQYLKNDELQDAKACLEKALNYTKSDINVDSILLSLSINNLCSIYMHHKRYKDAFMCSYMIVERLELHLKNLRLNKSQRLRQEVVPLINTYLLLWESLKKYLEVHHITDQKIKKQYVKYLDGFHSRGYRLSLKYLGKESIFTKAYARYSKPYKNYKEIKDIPIIYKQQGTNLDQSQLFRNLFDAIDKKMNPRIQQIMNLLMHREPIIQEVQKQAQVSKVEEPAVEIIHELQRRYQDPQLTKINTKLFKSEKLKFGKLRIQLSRKQKILEEKVIEEQDVMNITKNYNVNNTRPYSLKTENSSGQNFLKYFLIPFVHINDNHIAMKNYPTGIVPEKQLNFLGQKCLLIVNYITYNIFRISVYSLRLESTVCITVEFPQKQLREILETQKRTIDPEILEYLYAIKKQQNDQELPQVTESKKTVQSTIKIKNLPQFNQEMINIVSRVEQFIKNKKIFQDTRNSVFDQQLYFLKYKIQDWTKKGCIYCIKDLPKNLTFQVFLENTYHIAATGGSVILKGHSKYPYEKLIHDFGVAFSNLQRLNQKLQLFEILAQKYKLENFSFELTLQEKQTFSDNAIIQMPITSRLFRRKCLGRFKQCPVTASLLTIQQEPIGIKITGYDTQTIVQRGVFLGINKSKWKKIKAQAPPTQSQNGRTNIFLSKLGKYKYKDEFSFIADYYFQHILYPLGFDLLIDKIARNGDRQWNFFLKKQNQEIRWGTLQSALNLAQFQKKAAQLQKSRLQSV